jgi:hypothetical protein
MIALVNRVFCSGIYRPMRRIPLALLVAVTGIAQQPPEQPLPELAPFLQEVRKHLRSDRLLLSQYTYTARTTERELDAKGNTKKTDVEVYEVYPSLEEGETYERLIERNGKPIDPKELAKKDREHEKKAAERARKLEREGTSEREKRLAKEAEERRKEDEAIDEMFRLYQIEMLGREEQEGHSTIVLRFAPRPDFQTRTDSGKILKKLAGRAWVNESDHELIRIEAELIDNLSFGMGVLARLNKGAKAYFQRRRVNGEIWLPAEARFTGTGRLLLLKGLRVDQSMEFSDYRKFTVETSVSYPSAKDPE